jgi:ubiquinone/menaquinone biosynthesis C-methylase UbiE
MALEDEKQFFDHTFEHSSRRGLWKYYSVAQERERFYKEFLLAKGPGRRVLEYGCGTGSYAFTLAAHGAEVVGIDISEVAIRLAAERARAESLEHASFVEMNAEAMTFPDASFDLVCGTGILHHLDLERAVAELCRVMKHDGEAIFMEPLGHNPGLNLYRRATPQFRTRDEHPLMREHFDIMHRRFGKCRVLHYHLTSLLAVPLSRTPLFSPILKTFDVFDRMLFRLVPPLRWWSWYTVIVLGEPRR